MNMNGYIPDEIDLNILRLLQNNARLDNMEIARKVNLSRTPVSNRISKLRTAGFIKDYVAILDRERIGQPVLVVTHVKLNRQTTPLFDEFEQAMRKVPEVQFLFHVSGGWNYILHITATTPQAYFNFVMDKITGLENVAHVESCFVLHEVKTYGT